MNQTKTNKQRLAALILIVIGIVIYANALPNKMFWDDDDGIVKNAYIQDGRFLPKYFSENLIAGAGLASNYWRPALLISYALEWRFWQNWPPGFHATNVIIHIANAVLVFYLLWRLLKNWLLAFLPALFFLIHPLQTEAVSYVSGRADPLYALFTLLALIFYLKSKKKKFSKEIPSPFHLRQGYGGQVKGEGGVGVWNRLYLASVAAFILALMSKEAAIVLPGLVLLIDVFLWYKSKGYLKITKQLSLSFLRRQESISGSITGFRLGGRNDKTTIFGAWKKFVKTETKRLAPFVAIAGIYLLLRATVLHWTNSFAPYEPGVVATTSNVAVNLFTFFRTLADYVWLAIWPRNLHMERTLTMAASFWDARAIVGLILTVATAALVILYRKKRPEYLFAAGLFAVGLARIVPLLFDIRTTRGLMYEHWLYLAQIGFWLLITLLIRDLIKKYRHSFPSPFKGEGRACPVLDTGVRVWRALVNHGLLLLLLFLALNFSIRTVLRNRAWRDPITFYNDVLKYNQTSLRVWNNLGMAYAEIGQFQKAIDSYQAAIKLDAKRESAPPYHNIANAYKALGDYDKAIANYEKALRIDPQFIFSWRALAALHIENKEPDKARSVLQKAAAVFPESEEIQYYLRALPAQ